MTVKHDRVNLKADPVVVSSLLRDGQQLAVTAAAYAPKRTGDGARSIRAEVAGDKADPEVRVSWSVDAYYLSFIEFGTEEITAESFLRRAADEYR